MASLLLFNRFFTFLFYNLKVQYKPMRDKELLLPKHGGYRNLKSFQIGQLVYDMTVRFTECYIDRRSRTRDQMVQAARSGVQNIAEGSQASGTSKKTELKLTSVPRASLEELRLDYEDFLRQRGFPLWEPEHPALKCFRTKRCATLKDVQEWVADERKLLKKNRDAHRQSRTNTDNYTDDPKSVSVREGPCKSVPSSAFAVNAALSLLNIYCYFLDRQIAAQVKAFEDEGSFTERLHRVRSANRNRRS